MRGHRARKRRDSTESPPSPVPTTSVGARAFMRAASGSGDCHGGWSRPWFGTGNRGDRSGLGLWARWVFRSGVSAAVLAVAVAAGTWSQWDIVTVGRSCSGAVGQDWVRAHSGGPVGGDGGWDTTTRVPVWSSSARPDLIWLGLARPGSVRSSSARPRFAAVRGDS